MCILGLWIESVVDRCVDIGDWGTLNIYTNVRD